MRFRLNLLAAPFVMACVTATAVAQDGPSADRLIGAWRLVSVETLRPNGEVIYPIYGKHPQGLLIYDRSGWMSVTIISDPQSEVPRTDSRQGFLEAPAAEKLAAADAFYSYYGTWTVDPSGAAVVHHIQQSMLPGERGEDASRKLTLDGDRLILIASMKEMGEAHQRRLTWQRISAETKPGN
ncbi:lipocalin-like domain-containing protein [Acidobacteria bacterium AB60]|nr:lipocalin-like domain-containing protein [Acidobacteria bacterium AB60]